MRLLVRGFAAIVGFAIAPGAVLLAQGAAASASSGAGSSPPAAHRTFGQVAGRAGATYATDHVLVRFAPQTSTSQRNSISAFAHGRVTENFARVPGLSRVQLTTGTSVASAISTLRQRSDVLYAEPDYVVKATATTPNDSRFGDLWGLHNTGQTVNGVSGTSGDDIGAPAAWDFTTGSTSIKVAVIDSGVAIDHPDLSPNIWTNPGEVAGNGVDDDHNGFVDDVHGWNFVDGNNNVMDLNGHGTHVSGTIGAVGNNDSAGPGNTDVVGVNWHVSIMPVRVIGANGSGLVSDEINGITYAAQNGARVVNMSLGRSGGFSQAEHDAIAAATNTLFAVAAGNDGVDVGSSPAYPCSLALANMVCVAASDATDTLASFSNFGSPVDIAAPGVNVLSTYPFHFVVDEGFEQPLGSLWTFGGTPNTWGRSSLTAALGQWSLADSPTTNYSANNDNWARVGPLNLSSYDICRLSDDALSASQSGDNLTIETATSASGPWTQVGSYPGTGSAYSNSDDVAVPVSSSTYVRYHFKSNGTNNGDGVYVDDVRIRCHGPFDASNFAFFDGTSMATPHVAGAAALALSRFPALTTAQLKYRLLNLVDHKSSIVGLSSDRRLNVFKAVSYGAPTANAGSNQTVKPSANVTLSGTATDAGRGNLTVTWVQTLGPPVTLDNPHSLTAHFTAPSSPTTLQFKLKASTPEGPDVLSSAMTVTVKNPK